MESLNNSIYENYLLSQNRTPHESLSLGETQRYLSDAAELAWNILTTEIVRTDPRGLRAITHALASRVNHYELALLTRTQIHTIARDLVLHPNSCFGNVPPWHDPHPSERDHRP